MVYALRTCPSFKSPTLSKFDDLLRITLEKILNLQIGSSQWRRGSLLVSVDGLGIRGITQVAVLAYMASYFGMLGIRTGLLAQCDPTVGQSESAYAYEAQELFRDLSQAYRPKDKAIQKWDMAICKRVVNKMETCEETVEMKILNVASKEKLAGVWLNALPTSRLGLKLTDD